jgi:DNA-binding NarL/FixJ family response regulator
MEENVKILLIDDSPLALKSIRTVLELRPTWKIVAEAGNGRDGIAIFHQTQPNVVIVDFQMPEMNGLEVAREIRRTDSQVLLILFSLHAGKQLEEMAKAAGFDAVVSKAAAFPIVGVIETLNTRAPQLQRILNPAPIPVAEVVPAAVAKSILPPVIEAKQGLPSSLRTDEHAEPKRVGNGGGTVQS